MPGTQREVNMGREWSERKAPDSESRTPESLTSLNEKLQSQRAQGDSAGVAQTLTKIGNLLAARGEARKALSHYSQALAIREKLKDSPGSAETLAAMGRAHAAMGEQREALADLLRALRIEQAMGLRRDESATLSDMCAAHSDLGEEQKALENCSRSLAIPHGEDAGDDEAITLNRIGVVYRRLGREQEALETFRKALAEEHGNLSAEALTMIRIGVVYADLGQREKALDEFSGAALRLEPMNANVSDSPNKIENDAKNQALTYNNISWIHAEMGQQDEAISDLKLALSIQLLIDDELGQAYTLDSMGMLDRQMHDGKAALEAYTRALPLERAAHDRGAEAHSLWGLGDVQSEMGDSDKALVSWLAASSIAKTLGDPDLEGGIETSLMRHFSKQKQPEAAILFGTSAINSYQQMRRNIAGMDAGMRVGFAEAKSSAYRELAELLVESNRLLEAEQVLDLLKEQELNEALRGAAANAGAKLEPVRLDAAQKAAQGKLAVPEQRAEALVALDAEYAALLRNQDRLPEEEARLSQLRKLIEDGNSGVSALLQQTIFPELRSKGGEELANPLLDREQSGLDNLQNVLDDLGPRVMGIRLLLAPERAYIIVITAHTRKRFDLEASSAELRSKALEVREDLRSHRSLAQTKSHLADLYAMIAAPLEDELKALEQKPAQTPPETPADTHTDAPGSVPTLLWSLDGVMRYVPVAALYDGRRYLVERFSNVLITPKSYAQMAARPADGQKPSVLAMGLSKSYGGLHALSNVMPELDAVVHDSRAPGSQGPIEGRLLADDQFTLAALTNLMGDGKRFSIVHIASHFVLAPGSGEEPYLMLGGNNAGTPNGFAWSLSGIENSAISFRGTRLLTLSACSTAAGDAARDGRELQNLGMVFQGKKAEAVLATLWDVDDASTSRLMSDFYARWVKDPARGKGEALRQAQLALLSGSAAPIAAGNDRGIHPIAQQAAAAADEAAYSHPYFWAPFVLMGNFQ
jgi:CHAT domain-containing protein